MTMIQQTPTNHKTFGDLPHGATCTVTLAGEPTRVRKTPFIKSGSRAYNARKLDGRRGRTHVYADAPVTDVSIPETATDYKHQLLSSRQGAALGW